MLDSTTGLAVILASLGLSAVAGFRVRTSALDVEDYMAARDSQPAGTLALSFLASGMGVWILFAPPEVGAQVGAVAVAGYAVGAAAPILVFGLLGRRMRAVIPAGHSLTRFVRARFGSLFGAFVLVASGGYMLLFLAAELTAIGAVTAILSDTDPRAAIVAVAAVTLAYTAYGGLRASLRTDRWQGWLVLALLAAGAAALPRIAPGPAGGDGTEGLVGLRDGGWDVALALVIAVTAANLFHQGYWQRVWAAADASTLRRGALLGAGAIVPVVVLVGGLGTVAAARGLDLGDPPAPLFVLFSSLPAWVGGLILVLGVALVASSVDTLENGLASLVVAERPTTSLGLARVATAALMLPAAAIAVQGFSVLRLFLIADLLCAAMVVPVLFGLWSRMTSAGALAGGVAGMIGAVVPGWVATGSPGAGMLRATFPGAVPTLPPFAGALVASFVVAVAVTELGRRRPRRITSGGRDRSPTRGASS